MVNKNKEEYLFIFIFVLLTIFSTSPFFQDGLIKGHDLSFHLTRIESLKDSFLQGVFFPKINTLFLNGYGYAVDLFYPNLFLYIAAIFSLVFSLMFFIVIILFLSIFLPSLLLFDNMKVITADKLYNLDAVGIGMGKEYLPFPTSVKRIEERGNKITSNRNSVIIKNIEKIGVNLSFNYHSPLKAKITLPIIFYKGYSATVIKGDQKQKIKLYPGDNNLITTEIIGDGQFKLEYSGTFVQYVSNFLSLITFVICIFIYFFQGNK